MKQRAQPAGKVMPHHQGAETPVQRNGCIGHRLLRLSSGKNLEYSSIVCFPFGWTYEHSFLYNISTTPGLEKLIHLFNMPPIAIQIISILNNLGTAFSPFSFLVSLNETRLSNEHLAVLLTQVVVCLVFFLPDCTIQ